MVKTSSYEWIVIKLPERALDLASTRAIDCRVVAADGNVDNGNEASARHGPIGDDMISQQPTNWFDQPAFYLTHHTISSMLLIS
jgi:hypothetical protein